MNASVEPEAVLSFSPFDPAFRANPYPFYRTLYGRAPRLIEAGPYRQIALVGGYAACLEVLHDHLDFSSRDMHNLPSNSDPFQGAVSLLNSDPPDHSRLRRLVSLDFSPRRIRALEPHIRAITSELLERVATQPGFDVMADLANILPVRVIAEMLGVPPELHVQFKVWSDAIIGIRSLAPGAPAAPGSIEGRDQLLEYFAAEIERRRRRPGPDLISALLAAQEQAEILSAPELMRFLVLLLVAGNETTTNLIGNGILALGRHPEQMELLRQQPSLIGGAIEEILRYDGPVQTTVRRAVAPVRLDGTEIAAGTTVMVLLAAANRDPARFKDPERFDIRRTPNEHIAFGAGIHFCLGATLARLEGAIAIEMLLKRFPRLRLAMGEPPRYRESFGLRGLIDLPVATA
ncbi:MAG TPA: cytochrome P450 [Candidatus Binataceae bacterium]|nr:cytochrome P450 [Candidatus Binataceae bacterium]